MKKVGSLLFAIILLLNPVFAFARVSTSEKTINFAISDDRSISTDRILYAAFKELGYNTTFSCYKTIVTYELANNNEMDGIVSPAPDIESTYENLVKVPIAIGNYDFNCYSTQNLIITNWDDLNGKTIGLLSDKPYTQSKLPKGVNKILYKDNVPELFDSLLTGETDVIVHGSETNEKFLIPNEIYFCGTLESVPAFAYLNKKYANLVNLLTMQLSIMTANGKLDNILKGVSQDFSQKKSILYISSYNQDILRDRQLYEALDASFVHDLNVEFIQALLDSKRFANSVERNKYLSNILRQDFLTRESPVIVISGNEALNFIKDYYYLYFNNSPVILSELTNFSIDDISGFEGYFSGIVKDISAKETVELMLDFFPETQSIYVLNDYTLEGVLTKQRIEQQLADVENLPPVTYSENMSFAMLQQQLKNLPENSIVLVGSYFVDSDGLYYTQDMMMEFLKNNCEKPIFNLFSTNNGYGGVGGKAVDYKEYGLEINALIKKVLAGADVKDIPVTTHDSSANKWFFDQKQLDYYKIPKHKIPEDAIILNKTLTIWETDRKFAIAALTIIVLSVLTIFGLLIFLRLTSRTNKKLIEMQKNLHTAEEMLIKDASIIEIKERTERILNTAPVAFLLTIDDIVVETNEYMKSFLGVDIGSDVKDFYADISEFEDLFEKLKNFKAVKDLIIRYKMINGEIHRFHCNFSSIEYEHEKAFILWGIDIESNELQRDELQTAHEDMQVLLDSLPFPVRVHNLENNTIDYVNNAYLRLFEYDSNSQALNCSPDAIFDIVDAEGGSSQDILDKINNGLLTNKIFSSQDCKLVTNCGNIFDSEIVGCRINYKGSLASLCIIKDITKEREQAQMFINAAKKEKEANELKSKFLVNMSHEIRTPMNAIIGLTDIELRKAHTNEVFNIFKKISNAAKSLLQIINDILDLSKIEAEKMELFPVEFELEEILNSALLVVTPRLEGKPVELLLNVANNIPRYLFADKVRLWQILKNFLDNSAKYTDKGYIILSVEVLDDKETKEGEVKILFTVTDTGIGIDKEQLQKIFMPFKQIYNEAQQKYSGTGLGMAISKQVCELMNGELYIESEPNEGTTIKTIIPFKLTDNNETYGVLCSSPLLTGKRILVVDDEKFALQIIEKILTQNNAVVTCVNSGEEAISAINRYMEIGIRFDLIIMDYVLGGMNGVQTSLEIQSMEYAPKLVLVTAYQRELIGVDIKNSGFSDIIEKPFIPSEFVRKVAVALDPEGKLKEKKKFQVTKFTKFKNVVVLVCEDNKLNQEVANGMLDQFGIKAVFADDGQIGLETLEKQKFDLIFMDLQMPVLNGYETTIAIKQNPEKYGNAPIVSLTADAMAEVVKKCYDAGMDGYITKPISFEELHNILVQWLPDDKRAKEDDEAWKNEIDNIPYIEGVDIATGLARFGNKSELYKRSLIEFAKDLENALPPFTEVVKYIEMAKSSVHRLKGVSGNLAVDNIYKLTQQFEQGLRDDKPDKKQYQDLLDLIIFMKDKIENALLDKESEVVEAGFYEEFVQLITELREAMQGYDPIASSRIIDIMKRKTWDGVDNDALKQLYKLTQDYDFDSALEILDSIIKE